MGRGITGVLVTLVFFLEQLLPPLALSATLPQPLTVMPPVETQVFRPVCLRSVAINPRTPDVEVIIDKGTGRVSSDSEFSRQAKAVVEYFATGLRLPDSLFWVNLRPDQPDQIIDPALERTSLGKVMLAADLQLKKDLARMTSPESKEGKEYWSKLYAKAESLYGSGNVTVPTMVRPWIVPGEVIVRATPAGAYLYKAMLNVKLEQDYIKESLDSFPDANSRLLNEYSAKLISFEILPKLVKEINSAKRYAELRQVFYSLALAQYFKARFKDVRELPAFLSSIDSRDLSGLTAVSWDKQAYYREYLESIGQGEYKISDSLQRSSGVTLRTFTSGGAVLDRIVARMVEVAGEQTFAGPSSIMGNRLVVQQHDRLLQPITDGGRALTSPVVTAIGGGHGVNFWQDSGQDYTLERVITAFDGSIYTGEESEIISKISDPPSGSGMIRKQLPRMGSSADLTNWVDRLGSKPEHEYMKNIIKARFDKRRIILADGTEIAANLIGKGEEGFETAREIVRAIKYYYEDKMTREKDVNNIVANNNFFNFMQNLDNAAYQYDKYPAKLYEDVKFKTEAGEFLSFEWDQSVKNVIYTGLFLQNPDNANIEFSRLFEINDENVPTRDWLITLDLRDFELVAETDDEILIGQEEITQNLAKEAIRNIYLTRIADVERYYKNGRSGILQKVDNGTLKREGLTVNQAVTKRLLELDLANSAGSTGPNHRHMIVMGPGSQFTSELVHFLVPGFVTTMSRLQNTPRVLVLNPIRDAETAGLDDKQYFETVINFINKQVKEELPDADISDIFDFIIVNSTPENKFHRLNGLLLEENDRKKGKENKYQSKFKIDVIRYDKDSIAGFIKGLNLRHVLRVVGADLLEEVAEKREQVVRFGPYLKDELAHVDELYRQGKGDTRGNIFSSDHHATVYAAQLASIAHPNDAVITSGDDSDRGQNLTALLRLIYKSTAADHEYFTIGAALGVKYLVPMYLRMAFNYVNDNLLRDLGLENIPGAGGNADVEDVMRRIGWSKEDPKDPYDFAKKTPSQKAGKIYQYLFSKTFYEQLFNDVESAKTLNEDKGVYNNDEYHPLYTLNDRDRDQLLEELARVITYDHFLPLSKQYKDKEVSAFVWDNTTIIPNWSDILLSFKARCPEANVSEMQGLADLVGLWKKLRGDSGYQDSLNFEKVIEKALKAGKLDTNVLPDYRLYPEWERQLIGIVQEQINPRTSGKSRLVLLTEAERGILNKAENVFAEKLTEKNNGFFNVINYYLKAKLYEETTLGPQIDETDEMNSRGVWVVSSAKAVTVCSMHSLPPIRKIANEYVFVDLFGGALPGNNVKAYYDDLERYGFERVREYFNSGMSAPKPLLFAGYNAKGKKLYIAFDSWFTRMADSLYGPLFARKQERIVDAYVQKVKEADNDVYLFLHDQEKLQAKIEDLNKSGRKHEAEEFALVPDKLLKVLKTSFPEINGPFCFGHKKTSHGVEVRLGKNNAVELAFLDYDAALRGGEFGVLDTTGNTGWLVGTENSGTFSVEKTVNPSQIFMGEASLSKSLNDWSFREDTPQKAQFINELYGKLSEMRKVLIKSLQLRDVEYYDISIPWKQFAENLPRDGKKKPLLDYSFGRNRGHRNFTFFKSLVNAMKAVFHELGVSDERVNAIVRKDLEEWSVADLRKAVEYYRDVVLSDDKVKTKMLKSIEALIKDKTKNKGLLKFVQFNLDSSKKKIEAGESAWILETWLAGDLAIDKLLVIAIECALPQFNVHFSSKPQLFREPLIGAQYTTEGKKFYSRRLDVDVRGKPINPVLPDDVHDSLDKLGTKPFGSRNDGSRDGGNAAQDDNLSPVTHGGVDFRATMGVSDSVVMPRAEFETIAAGSRFNNVDFRRAGYDIRIKIASAQSCAQLPCNDIKEYLAICACNGKDSEYSDTIKKGVLQVMERDEMAGVTSSPEFRQLLAFMEHS